jgi:energy-converting hydrogenase A subunit M
MTDIVIYNDISKSHHNNILNSNAWEKDITIPISKEGS